MDPPCASCKNTAYPIELKLECLDKCHKACFTCEACNLKLTISICKEYNKLPSPDNHCPTEKLADTPEDKTLAKQTENLSEPPWPPQHVAMYDYTAANDSEVSFVEGDIIIYNRFVDYDWMEGTVKRTGQRGMLPSGYVKQQ